MKDSFENLIKDLREKAPDVKGLLSLLLQGSLATGDWIEGWSDADIFIIAKNFENLKEITKFMLNEREKYPQCDVGWILITKEELKEWIKYKELPVIINSAHGEFGFTLDKVSLHLTKNTGKIIYGWDFRKLIPEIKLQPEDVIKWLKLFKEQFTKLEEYNYEKLRLCIRRIKNCCQDMLAFKNIFVKTSEIPQKIKEIFPQLNSEIIEELFKYRKNWNKVKKEISKEKIKNLIEEAEKFVDNAINFFKKY